MKRVAFIAGLLLLTGCHSWGPPLVEDGRVEDLTYLPPSTGTGFTTSGDAMIVSTDAVYGVVFSCQHGRFAVTGSGSDYQRLWKSLPKGGNVRITYRVADDGCMDFIAASPH